MAKKPAKKAATKTTASKSKKFSFISAIHDSVVGLAEVTRKGEVKMQKAEFKAAIENAFSEGVKRAAGGERVRFPVIGALVRRDVKERKSGKGVNPFTGEAITIKARPASKKPKWSFPKTVKETFADKKLW